MFFFFFFFQQLLMNFSCLRWFDSYLVRGVPYSMGGTGCTKVAVRYQAAPRWIIWSSSSCFGDCTF